MMHAEKRKDGLVGYYNNRKISQKTGKKSGIYQSKINVPRLFLTSCVEQHDLATSIRPCILGCTALL